MIEEEIQKIKMQDVLSYWKGSLQNSLRATFTCNLWGTP